MYFVIPIDIKVSKGIKLSDHPSVRDTMYVCVQCSQWH